MVMAFVTITALTCAASAVVVEPSRHALACAHASSPPLSAVAAQRDRYSPPRGDVLVASAVMAAAIAQALHRQLLVGMLRT